MFLKRLSTIITLVILAVALFIAGSFLPTKDTYTFRVVESGSMEPSIQTGSVVVTIPRDNYAVGDVVTFKSPTSSTPTTHRLVGVADTGSEATYTTKGDANEDADYQTTSESDILGRVFLVIPYAGYVSAFAQTKAGIVILVLVPLLIVAFLEIRSIVSGIRERKRNTKKDKEKINHE